MRKTEKKRNWRQASEARREKGRRRYRARDRKQRGHFLLEEEHEDFVVAVTK